MKDGGWIAVGIAGLVLIVGFIAWAVNVFVLYTNRYGKKLVLRKDVFSRFENMRDQLKAGGIDIEMTDAWRGETAQEKAVQQGASRAHFGMSPHNFGVAFDVAPVIGGKLSWTPPPGTWETIGAAGRDNGLVWGGTFKSIVDLPHFELPGWTEQNLALLREAPEAVAV